MTSTITLTFGDRAENHKGMQIIGESAIKGYTLADLQAIEALIGDPTKTELIALSTPPLPPAYVLIIRAATESTDSTPLATEMVALEWDKKAMMYGRVVNKKARHNLCFDDVGQLPDYSQGKGTIVAFNTVPYLKQFRDDLWAMLCNAGVETGDVTLKVEGNYYYDVSKCGIGYHGDTERKKVIGMRIGATMPLYYQWWHKNKPIGKPIELTIKNGDMYIMCEKAVGTDWKKSTLYTLRHAAGCKLYTKIEATTPM